VATALERLAEVDHIVFDKTGTLTSGMPLVASIQCADDIDEDTGVAIAVAMETGSTHPYASALRERQSRSDIIAADTLASEQAGDAQGLLEAMGYPVDHLSHEAGHGVSATLTNNDALFLGSAQWCQLESEVIAHWRREDSSDAQAASEVYLVVRTANAEVRVLARFLIRDALRKNTFELVDKLKQHGLQVHLLSGDRAEAVQVVAKELEISQFAAAATPENKQAYVKALQQSGKVVLMVGDGVNDAPVLASADVSMAAGDATALARTAADVISLQPGLDGLPQLLIKSQQTSRIVKQNLVWAASYNLLAIPLAALGYVPPWAAAIGMALSSLLVVGNAQRLWSRNAQEAVNPAMLVRNV